MSKKLVQCGIMSAGVRFGTCFICIRHRFGVAATAPFARAFSSRSLCGYRSEFSTIAKNRSRAALTASRSLSLDRTLALVHSRPQPHESERLHKNDHEQERRQAQHHRMAEIFISPLKLKSFQKRFLISVERMY